MKEVKIGNKTIGGENPCFIVAEISCNHLQDKTLALKLIEDAKKSGVDAVKFQLYTPDSITFDFKESNKILNETIWEGKSLYELYSETYTPREWFPELKAKAEELGLIFFASPFSEEEVDYLETLNVPCYKLASFEINHIPLIKRIAKTKKPIIISTGVSTLDDIDLALKTIRKYHNKIILLKCNSAYPSPPEELNLRTIEDMRNRYEVLVGLSDHTTSVDSSILSLSLGCCLIEKHLKLSCGDLVLDSETESELESEIKDKLSVSVSVSVSETIASPKSKSHDDKFSLNVQQFTYLVNQIRKAEVMLGKVSYALGKETEKHFKLRRSVYVVKDIVAGETFTKDNIRVIRPVGGIHPKQYEKMLGKKAFVNIKAGKPLTLDLVEQELII